MRLRDINTRQAFNVWAEFLPTGEQDIPAAVKALLNMDSAAFLRYSREDTYSLNYGSKFIHIKLSDDGDITPNTLNHYLSRGGNCLAEALAIDANNRVQFRIVFFSGITAEFDTVEVGITDKVAESAARSGITKDKTITETLCRDITEMCRLKAGNDDYFIVKTGGDFHEDFPDEEETDTPAKSFQLCGKSLLMSVERKTLGKGEIFSATRTVFRNAELRGNITLAHGKIDFKPRDSVSEIRLLAAQAMEQLTSTPDSYLATWELYAETEKRIENDRAAKIGKLHITNAEPKSGYTRFFAAEDIDTDNLHKGDALEFAEDADIEGKTPPFYEVLDVRRQYVDLKTQRTDGKTLVLSMRGYEVMQGRRSDAIALIKAGMSANPLLGLILEENGELPEGRQVSSIKPLTPLLEGKIFRFPPTERQREAIDVALNTPDIALIQGPPGTGKTTVITAIIERLNQEFDKRGITRGQVLVSAFQHDAVANIVSRLWVNSLPAYKFGGKKDSEGESVSDSEGELERWCANLAKSIRAKHPSIARVRDAEELNERIDAYCSSPSDASGLSLMLRAAEIPGVKASSDLYAQINAIISELKPQDTAGEDPALMRKIFALRVGEVSFLDDGADRALELYDYLDSINYDAHALTLLRKASMWNKDTPPDFLPELLKLRKRLIAEFKPETRYTESKPRSDMLEAAREAANLIKSARDTFSEQEKILAEFLLDIENNPDSVIEAVKDYQFVYSATVQQSIGKEIDEQVKRTIALTKGNPRDFYNMVSVNDDSIRFPIYDTVIVDEAARALPMDLLIPMVQGEKRIILVGDHRQLPHIIDEDIANAMDDGQDDKPGRSVNDYLKMSMFKYLFSRLKALEAKDGIKRTVTLDSQYRMHPLLGEFVSRNFYDTYGEGFASPVGAEHFRYSLPDLGGKPLAWLEVPTSAGPEGQTSSKSRVRRAEAEAIARYLAKWLKAAENTNYTFGVISFYAAQKNLIEDALARNGINLSDNKSRLQVGTVDAFQGKEFDIVILSAVRTGARKSSPRGTFGHLMSENRLCVSMSRQKRALVVAGTSELFGAEFAAKNVPAMFN